MRERILKVGEWQKNEKKIALATLVKVYGSAPEPLGAVMAVNEALEFDGSVSGGCVEGDVIRQSTQVIKTGEPRLVEYGISNDTAWDAGLACGGTIEVFIEPMHPGHVRIMQLLQQKQYFATVTILNASHAGSLWIVHKNGDMESTNESQHLDQKIHPIALEALENNKPVKTRIEVEGETVDVFCAVHPPPARLLIIGAVHIAIPLVSLAGQLGFETVVIDARSAFATRERFPHANQLVVDWPSTALEKLGIDENTYLAFLSHDDKMDNPALIIALNSKARYIGALGSRKTHAARVQSLIELGATQSQLEQIHAPIGLKIGANGAEQIALSIMAEIIAIGNAVEI